MAGLRLRAARAMVGGLRKAFGIEAGLMADEAVAQFVTERFYRNEVGSEYGVSLADKKGAFIQTAASFNFDQALLLEIKRIPAGAGACGKAFAERRRVIVQDTETDPLFEEYRETARKEGYRAVHSTPILGRTL